MIKFHNPAAKTAVAPEQYELSCDLRPNEGADLTVGLLANGFPDSEVFNKNNSVNFSDGSWKMLKNADCAVKIGVDTADILLI